VLNNTEYNDVSCYLLTCITGPAGLPGVGFPGSQSLPVPIGMQGSHGQPGAAGWFAPPSATGSPRPVYYRSVSYPGESQHRFCSKLQALPFMF